MDEWLTGKHLVPASRGSDLAPKWVQILWEGRARFALCLTHIEGGTTTAGRSIVELRDLDRTAFVPSLVEHFRSTSIVRNTKDSLRFNRQPHNLFVVSSNPFVLNPLPNSLGTHLQPMEEGLKFASCFRLSVRECRETPINLRLEGSCQSKGGAYAATRNHR